MGALRPNRGSTRGVSPVVGVVLTVGITVLLAASVAGAITPLDGELATPTPTVAASSGTFEVGPSVGCTDNVVRIVHEGGAPVSPDELAVGIALSDPKRTARLVDLPVAGTRLGAENLAGDTGNIVYDNCVGGVIADGGSPWAAGTAIKFELNAGGGTIARDDRIEVTVVHEPSGSALVRERLRAR